MNKNLGATFLVAGTCIGSGMIALPMVLAKLGLIFSILLMLFIWFIMYYTSLINLELNLQAGYGLPLGALGRKFSGKGAEMIGVASIKILSYSLLAVFIYGGSSVVQELLATTFGEQYTLNSIAICYSLSAIFILLLPMKLIDHINRSLFAALLAVVAILLIGLLFAVNFTHLPLLGAGYSDLGTWAACIPVVFTSFGFQVIFHTLTNYTEKNTKLLKQAFFFGSLIPAIVYILWTSCVLSVAYNDNPVFYEQMVMGNVEVGELVRELSHVAKWQSVQLLVWWISLLAIATSVLGVGVGLCQALERSLSVFFKNGFFLRLIAAVLTVLPGYLVAVYVPNAFIAALGFAGMILAIIAIILPTYLFFEGKFKQLHYPELYKSWLISLSFLVAIVVIVSEVFNML